MIVTNIVDLRNILNRVIVQHGNIRVLIDCAEYGYCDPVIPVAGTRKLLKMWDDDDKQYWLIEPENKQQYPNSKSKEINVFILSDYGQDYEERS